VQKNLSEIETDLMNGTLGTAELEERLRQALRIVQDARVGNPEDETPVLY
jgi:hypothetical protein